MIRIVVILAGYWWNKSNADNIAIGGLVGQGKYDEAIQAIDRAIQLIPNSTEAWINRGNVLYLQGKYAGAVQAYNKSLQIEPNNADALYGSGYALMQLHRDQEAHQAFWAAQDAYLKKGLALEDQGKYNDALTCFNRNIEIQPNSYGWLEREICLRKLSDRFG